jgi:dsRNA-specific ribonuclease
MRALAPVGAQLLDFLAANWITQNLSGLTGAQISSLVQAVTSDEALSRVLTEDWRMGELILTDQLVDVLRKHGSSAGGLAKWQAATEKCTSVLPSSMAADALRSMVGSVYANHGLNGATGFCAAHVLPHCPVP